MAVEIQPTSYLLFSKLFNADGVQFWDLPEFPELRPQDDDIFINVGVSKTGEIVPSDENLRIDLMSFRIYGTPHLWWAIALRNNYEIVPSEFKLGEKIVVPSPRYIFQEVLPKARG